MLNAGVTSSPGALDRIKGGSRLNTSLPLPLLPDCGRHVTNNSCDSHHAFPLMMDHGSLNCEPKQIFFFLVAFVTQQLEK